MEKQGLTSSTVSMADRLSAYDLPPPVFAIDCNGQVTLIRKILPFQCSNLFHFPQERMTYSVTYLVYNIA